MLTPRIRTIWWLAAMVGVAVVLAGCGSANTNAADLEGSWKLESFGGTTALVPADPAVATEMTLAEEEARGKSGVNAFSGPYAASNDGTIGFGVLSATEMAGPPAAMKQEAAFFAALDKTKHFEFNDGKLLLSDTGNNTLLVMVRR
jgi:heat shock protein HslJ